MKRNKLKKRKKWNWSLVQCSQKVRFKLRSTTVLKNSALSERRTGLVVRFGAFAEPWTEPRSSFEKFRFELWFRTELRHPYFSWARRCFFSIFWDSNASYNQKSHETWFSAHSALSLTPLDTQTPKFRHEQKKKADFALVQKWYGSSVHTRQKSSIGIKYIHGNKLYNIMIYSPNIKQLSQLQRFNVPRSLQQFPLTYSLAHSPAKPSYPWPEVYSPTI